MRQPQRPSSALLILFSVGWLLGIHATTAQEHTRAPDRETEILQANSRYFMQELHSAMETADSTVAEGIFEDATLVASDGGLGNLFGFLVAISGDTVVVAAPHVTTDQGSYSGSAYVFEKPAHGWSGTLTEVAKLLPSDGATDDTFGTNIGISGSTVVVGNQNSHELGPYRGAAYIFERPLSGWTGTLFETAKLSASDGAAHDRFGTAVAISGDTVVVGAAWTDDMGRDSGSAYVFERPPSGWTGRLYESAKLLLSDGTEFDYFGTRLSISGDVVASGLNRPNDENGPQSGSAYVFEKPSGGWFGTVYESAKLIASDGASHDHFGWSVAASEDVIAVTATHHDAQGADSGSAYVFEKPASGWTGTLTEVAKLLPSDGVQWDFFGDSVGLAGDIVVVGTPLNDDPRWNSGSAYIFMQPSGGWSGTLSETAKLFPSDGQARDEFGGSVGVSDDTIVVGAIGRSENGYSGSAYIFDNPPTFIDGFESGDFSKWSRTES